MGQNAASTNFSLVLTGKNLTIRENLIRRSKFRGSRIVFPKIERGPDPSWRHFSGLFADREAFSSGIRTARSFVSTDILGIADHFRLESAQRWIFRRDIFSGILRVAGHFLLEPAQRAILRCDISGRHGKALFAFWRQNEKEDGIFAQVK